MAKTFIATLYEVGVILDGDLGLSKVWEDWYRQRFVANANELLGEPLNIEFPFALPRDAFDSPIIPGGVTVIEDTDTISDLKKCLGVEPDADYIFSVLTGKHYRAHDGKPSRFALIEPKRARDIVLMASWPKDAPSPSNFAEDEICKSPVLRFAAFDDDGRGYCSATWIIRTISPLGECLIDEVQQTYADCIQASVDHFKGYAENCDAAREALWERLAATARENAEGKLPVAIVLFGERYLRLEWYNEDDDHCLQYCFYTDVGAHSVIDFTNSLLKKEQTTFAIFKDF